MYVCLLEFPSALHLCLSISISRYLSLWLSSFCCSLFGESLEPLFHDWFFKVFYSYDVTFCLTRTQSCRILQHTVPMFYPFTLYCHRSPGTDRRVSDRNITEWCADRQCPPGSGDCVNRAGEPADPTECFIAGDLVRHSQ